jgi:hypothetical protein
VKVGEDKNRASLAAAIPDAIRLRAGVEVKNPHERPQQLRHRSLADMARTFFVSLGVPTEEAYNLSPVHVAELLGPRNFARKYPQYAQLAQSSSDFTSILADTINKTLRNAYMDAPSTWNRLGAADHRPGLQDHHPRGAQRPRRIWSAGTRARASSTSPSATARKRTR